MNTEKKRWLKSVSIFKIKAHVEESCRENKMFIRNKIHENRDLASLPMEPPMPGKVADKGSSQKGMNENSQTAKESQ